MNFPLAALQLFLPPWAIGLFIGAGVFGLILFGLVCYWLNRSADGPIDPGVPEKDQANQRGCMVVFGGVFLLAGLAMLVFITLLPVYRSYRADGWPTVQGTVLSSRLQESRDSDGVTYRIDIQYRYPVNGKVYESTQYDSSGTHSFSNLGLERKQAIVQDHRPGKPVTVHYDPADPADAMLTTTLPAGTLSFVWFPLVFMGAGLAIMFIVPAVHFNTGGKPVAAKAAPLASAEISADQTRRKRYGRAFGISLFALVWNGFIAGCYFLSGGSWCLIPFALVGVGLIAFAGYSGLQLLNPAVSVTFARMPMRPGESTNVTFALDGNLFAVRELTFTLEGREKVTYRQGTDTRSETHVAWRIECFQTTNPAQMESGRFAIDLPADVMTTFVASNNQFTWHLICHGDVPGRPDISDEFDVTVLPRPGRTSEGT